MRLLVLGAGVSGMAAARLGRSLGHSVTVFDSQPAPEAMDEGFGVAIGEWDADLLNGVDLVIASPGFSERTLPIVESLESGVPIWSEIEFASRHIKSPIAAVTGTNGKTSVTEATSAMLEASGLDAPATGNIGAPLSDFADTRYDALVVEVSSFQLRFTETFHPVAAAITNIAVDHLDWHGSEHSYRDSKRKVFANQTAGDLLVFSIDDPGATDLSSAAVAERFPISGISRPDGGGGPEDGFLVVRDVSIDLAHISPFDVTHLSNLGCAAALALRMGATREGVIEGATEYRPAAHRRTTVAVTSGVTWIDDSKATNPHAALSSIRAQDSVVLIAGGLAKGLDITPLGSEPNVKLLLGIGEAGQTVADSAGVRGRNVKTLEAAVAVAVAEAQEGDTVLLAPGCASFDQFDSYEARGNRFATLVLESIGTNAQ